MGLINEVLQKFGIDRSVAAEISSSVKRFKPVLKYGVKVNSLDLTADELEAILTGGDSSSLVTGITAYAGGGQANATALTGRWNNVTTVATAADSVKLPSATAGLTVTVRNGAANALAVFPDTGDAINALSANASITVPTLGIMTFTAINSTTWYSSIGVTEAAQTITGAKTFSSAVVVNAVLQSGSSGTTGILKVFPPTESKGQLTIGTDDNTGNTVTSIVVNAQANARTYSIPDWSTKASADTECSIAGIKVVANTTNRPGALGCLLFSTGDSKLYVCTTASATAATWTVVGSQS